MPAIQYIDNPYAGKDAASSGIANLLNATEIKNRRDSQLWSMMKDLPKGLQGAVMRDLATGRLGFRDSEPQQPQETEKPQSPSGEGISSFKTEKTGLAGIAELLPDGSTNKDYDPNVIHQSTIDQLGIGDKVDILKRQRALKTAPSKAVDREVFYNDGKTRSDEESTFDGGISSKDRAAYDKAMAAPVTARDIFKVGKANPKMTGSAIEERIRDDLAVKYRNEMRDPEGKVVSVVGDNPQDTPPPQETKSTIPVRMQTVQANHYKGPASFASSGGEFTPQAKSEIDAKLGEWGGVQDRYAEAMAVARKYGPEAMQYVDMSFPDHIQAYDNGASKARIDISSRAGSSRGNGYIDGNGETGFLMVDGVWRKTSRMNTGDPRVDALTAIIGLRDGGKNPKASFDEAIRTIQMANDGDEDAKSILAFADNEGSAFATSKLFGEDVANKNPYKSQEPGLKEYGLSLRVGKENILGKLAGTSRKVRLVENEEKDSGSLFVRNSQYKAGQWVPEEIARGLRQYGKVKAKKQSQAAGSSIKP